MAQVASVSALTDKFTSIVFDKLLQEVSLVATFRQDFLFLCDEVNSMKGMLKDAGLLTDAPDERISSSMSSWLTKIEDFLTDAQYVVEDCADASKCQLRNPYFRWRMGRRIKELKDKSSNFQWSSKHVKYFESVLNVNNHFQTSSISAGKQTSSQHVTEKDPVGMKEEIEKFTNRLLQSDGPPRIAIVGMGGSGKTLLLQHVFNNKKVSEAGFDARVWLPISQKYEIQSLLLEIIRQIKFSRVKYAKDLPGSALEDVVKEALEGKCCLFAIDDVWDQQVLESIGLNLQERQHKVVITTREKRVASKYFEVYEMPKLSEDDSRSLFYTHAFPENKNHTPPTELVDVAQSIEKKCCRVPLALKTIGGYMARKGSSFDDWESTMKHLEAEHLQAEAMSSEVMPCLRLSYQTLPCYLKLCFLYFSAFPKNTEIKTEYLVYAWISEGFIPNREDAYNVGRSYVNELIDRCLIDGTEFGGDGRPRLCKMHDFLHELADSIEQPRCLLRPGGDLDNSPTEERVRLWRISLNKSKISDIKQLNQYARLRTLLLSDTQALKAIPASVFNKLRYLSVLDLSRSSIKSLPRSIGKLYHLKFLNLSGTTIEKLPESLSNLRRLLFLDVSNCEKLKSLHRGIGKHKSILHLNVEGCKELVWLPVGISKLVSLQTLKGVVFKKESEENPNAFKLKDLKGLILLVQLSLSVNQEQWPFDGTSDGPSPSAKETTGDSDAEQLFIDDPSPTSKGTFAGINADQQTSDDCSRSSEAIHVEQRTSDDHSPSSKGNFGDINAEQRTSDYPSPSTKGTVAKIDAEYLTSLKAFGDMKKMRTLSFRNNDFDEPLSLPEEMNVMKHLEIVRLYTCHFPEWMFKLQNLMELELQGHHKCSGEKYKGLEKIPNLRKLQLAHFWDLPEEFGKATAFPKLEELVLQFLHKKFPILEKGVMPKLKRLRIEACPDIGNDCVQFFKNRGVQVTQYV